MRAGGHLATPAVRRPTVRRPVLRHTRDAAAAPHLAERLQVDKLDVEQRAEDDDVLRLQVDDHQLARVQVERRVAEALEDVLPLHLGHRALREVLREVEGARLEDQRDGRVVVVVGVVKLDGEVGAQVRQQLFFAVEVRLCTTPARVA